MIRQFSAYLVIAIALILLGLGTLSAYWEHKDAPIVQQQMSEKVNLALRQTAHLLLKQVDDSTSAIAPIKQTSTNVYLVRLEHYFHYDSLPILLRNSFKMYNITAKYDVAVWNCNSKELMLGYSSLVLSKEGDIPCLGRNQAVGCYNFTVNFTDLPTKSNSFMTLGLFLGILTMSIFVTISYFIPKKKKGIPPSVFIPKKKETHLITLGNSIFDTQLQTISMGNNQQKLTFRESQLLELFYQYKNEVLDRDFILKQIWEDDGVLVSRSVDVFVSRLRKILKNDMALKISNIHNRGYRLDIAEG